MSLVQWLIVTPTLLVLGLVGLSLWEDVMDVVPERYWGPAFIVGGVVIALALVFIGGGLRAAIAAAGLA